MKIYRRKNDNFMSISAMTITDDIEASRVPRWSPRVGPSRGFKQLGEPAVAFISGVLNLQAGAKMGGRSRSVYLFMYLKGRK